MAGAASTNAVLFTLAVLLMLALESGQLVWPRPLPAATDRYTVDLGLCRTTTTARSAPGWVASLSNNFPRRLRSPDLSLASLFLCFMVEVHSPID